VHPALLACPGVLDSSRPAIVLQRTFGLFRLHLPLPLPRHILRTLQCRLGQLLFS
jgi:hypothetical protein